VFSIAIITVLRETILSIASLFTDNLENWNGERVYIHMEGFFNGQYLDYYLSKKDSLLFNPLYEGLICGIILGLKSCIMIFIFIWARASFPRIRFDQLMSFCWTILLPIVIAFIILVPCILYSFEILPSNILLL
jgi:NADH-ubiquinone oxidoreductase chain 1